MLSAGIGRRERNMVKVEVDLKHDEMMSLLSSLMHQIDETKRNIDYFTEEDLQKSNLKEILSDLTTELVSLEKMYTALNKVSLETV